MPLARMPSSVTSTLLPVSYAVLLLRFDSTFSENQLLYSLLQLNL